MLMIDALDRQVEVLDPRREHVAQHALRFLDSEPALALLLHERCFLSPN